MRAVPAILPARQNEAISLGNQPVLNPDNPFSPPGNLIAEGDDNHGLPPAGAASAAGE